MEAKEKYVLSKIYKSKTRRHRIVTTDLEMLKAARNLSKRGLIQYKFLMQPAQPMGLIVHDDRLNKASDWAEKMVCQIVGAKQTAWNCKGHDGVLEDGTKIEVKAIIEQWHNKKKGIKKLEFSGLSIDILDIFIGVVKDETAVNDITKATFIVIDKNELPNVMQIGKKVRRIYAEKGKPIYEKLMQYQCTLAELAELKHGYDHFLKMKGKVPPIEPPKESIQFVIDVWEPNKFNLMPFDFKFESDDWYAEYVVSQLLCGTITEERNEGFDVVMKDGTNVSVKFANIAPNCYTKSGITYKINFYSLKTSLEYDLFIGLYWDDLNFKYSNDINTCKVLIIPKEIVDVIKITHTSSDIDNGELKFTVKSKGKYRKDAAIHKFRPFMFTIFHIEELGVIGYEAFYDRYLKEPCEQVLGKEEVIEKEMTESYTPSYPALPFPGWSSAMVPSSLNVYQPSSLPS